MKDLQTIVTRDMTAAGVEAQRQLDEVKSEMRRVWNSAKRAFSDSFGNRNGPSDEAAAKDRT
jgi:hypothetical protein